MNSTSQHLLDKLFSYRKFYIYSFIACFVIIGTSIYVEYFLFYLPCPLCILQRIMYIAVGVVSFIALIHNPQKLSCRLSYPLFTIFFVLLGFLVSARQIYLQHQPKEQLHTCLGGILDILDNYPFLEAIQEMLKGGSECGTPGLLIFGQNMAVWSFIIFLGFIIANIVLIRVVIRKG